MQQAGKQYSGTLAVSGMEDVPTELLDRSGPSGDAMIRSVACGETCVGRVQLPSSTAEGWELVSPRDTFRSKTPEIAVILVMCLIDSGCGSLDPACSLEQ